MSSSSPNRLHPRETKKDHTSIGKRTKHHYHLVWFAEDGEESAVRKQYLKVRSQLLQKRYGVSCDQGQSSRSMSIRSNSRISESPENSRFPAESKPVMTPNSEQGEVVPTKQADASRAIVGGTTIAENYAFVGVHHI
ncbi:unnamed protein product, partial [Timema podura]|nr:unnamed protein product [Timema podura]